MSPQSPNVPIAIWLKQVRSPISQYHTFFSGACHATVGPLQHSASTNALYIQEGGGKSRYVGVFFFFMFVLLSVRAVPHVRHYIHDAPVSTVSRTCMFIGSLHELRVAKPEAGQPLQG